MMPSDDLLGRKVRAVWTLLGPQALQKAIRRALHAGEGLGLGAELNADEAIAHGAALLSVARLDPAALGHGERGRLLLPVRCNTFGSGPAKAADHRRLCCCFVVSLR